MAESAEDREIVACFESGAERPFFEDHAPHVGHRISRLRVVGGWREVVFVAGVTLDLGAGWVGPFLVAGVIGIATALPLALGFRERPLVTFDRT